MYAPDTVWFVQTDFLKVFSEWISKPHKQYISIRVYPIGMFKNYKNESKSKAVVPVSLSLGYCRSVIDRYVPIFAIIPYLK